MTTSASDYIAHKIETNDEGRLVRARALEVEVRVLASVDAGFRLLNSRSKASTRGQAKRNEVASQLMMVVDSLVTRLYFLIGAGPREDGAPPSSDLTKRIYTESMVLWQTLAGTRSKSSRPMFASTVHHLVESFNTLLPINPSEVLEATARLITTTRETSGYAFDALAIQPFVQFAEKMLADHKDILREGNNAVYFAEILDAFVSAGWPIATQFVMRLDAALR
jgi:hypothetical protein